MNPKLKRSRVMLTVVCLIATILTLSGLGSISPPPLQSWLERAGIWAPVVYVGVCTIATALLLHQNDL
ncbi:hypothetical protein ACKFKG_03250 [Phormidesmis sp. 146-35]